MGIDPRGYMRDTLRRIVVGDKDLDALLPENYKPHVSDANTHDTGALTAAA